MGMVLPVWHLPPWNGSSEIGSGWAEKGLLRTQTYRAPIEQGLLLPISNSNMCQGYSHDRKKVYYISNMNEHNIICSLLSYWSQQAFLTPLDVCINNIIFYFGT